MEIEAKMKLADVDAMIHRLDQLDADRVERLAETNIFLDTPGLTLRGGDCGLRVRAEDNVDDPSASRVVVTHKGPRMPGPIKQRPETEMHVHDVDDAIALLGVLGFVEQLRFEKHRQRWRLDHCTIELDELPAIGRFIEIEGPDEAAVMALRDKLGLSDEPMITDSYASMVHAYLENNKQGGRVLRF